MQRLILVTNMSLPNVEAAIAKFADRLAAKTDTKADYEILFGRADYAPRVYHRSIVLMLGTETYKTNSNHINPKAVGIILDNPMTLGCIKGENVVRFDFRVKKDGIGIYLETKSVDDLMNEIRKAYFADTPAGVTTRVLDHIPNTLVPNVLGSIKETTTFAKEFASLNYSVRNELDRDRIRRALFTWILSKESTQSLHDRLQKIVGKNTAAIRNLVETFDPESDRYKHTATNIRKALTESLSLVKLNKNNIPFEKIAAKFFVSPYDLKYAAHLFKKDPLLIADLRSTDVHYNNTKFRSTGAQTADGQPEASAAE